LFKFKLPKQLLLKYACIITATLTAALTIHCFGQQSKDRTPNIIYICADDLGYGELEAYGQLFNLKDDRNETNHLAAKNPEMTKRLDEIVQTEHHRSHLKEWEFINPLFEEAKF
jgi:hypothetical protein